MPFQWDDDERPDPLDGLDTEPTPDEPEPSQPTPAPVPPPPTVRQASVNEVVADLEESASAEDAMSEVERRLEKAQFYKALLNHQLLGSDSDIAIEVEEEVQDFVRERLEVLMGLRHANTIGVDTQAALAELRARLDDVAARTPELPFSPEQVEALLALANKVLGKAAATPPAPKPVPKPAVVPVAAPPKPAAPVVKPAVAKEAPSLPKRGRGRPKLPRCEICGVKEGHDHKPNCGKTTAEIIASEKAAKATPPAPVNNDEERFETAPDGTRYKYVGHKKYKMMLVDVQDKKTGKITQEWIPLDVTGQVIPKEGVTPFPSEDEQYMQAATEQQAMLAKAPKVLNFAVNNAVANPSANAED